MTVEWLGTPLQVSNSEIQTYKDCRRRWYLSYYLELGIRRAKDAPTGARQLGTKIHIALCAMYAEGRNPVDVLNELYKEDKELFAEFPDKLIELGKEQDLGKAMMEGYVEWLLIRLLMTASPSLQLRQSLRFRLVSKV